jgi:hypothetical protein
MTPQHGSVAFDQINTVRLEKIMITSDIKEGLIFLEVGYDI